MTNDLRDKVQDAFKGFIKTYKLLPVNKRQPLEDSNYIQTWKNFDSKTESYELFYKKQTYDRVVDLIDRLFHAQTDRKFVGRCLGQMATEWIEKGYSPNDQNQLEQMAANLIEKVEGEIKDYVVYIPLEGIRFESSKELELARCQLCRNHEKSELVKVIQQDRKRRSIKSRQLDEGYPTIEKAPAFFRVKLLGHSGRVIQRSKDEADLALNVLRLFIGSSYWDIHRRKSITKQTRS